MGRGRPAKSLIRERMQQVVDALGVSYGYEIYKVYEAAFSPIELRAVYYHLNSGVARGEFELVGVKLERGAYTWGDVSMRRYYILGPEAQERAKEELHVVVKGLGMKHKDPKDYVDWNAVLKEKTQTLLDEFARLTKVKVPNIEALGRLNKQINAALGWFEENKIKTKELENLIKEVQRFLGH